jgi:hypothetical protein
MAKAPRIMPKAPPYIMLKAPNKMPFDNFKPAKSIKEDQRWSHCLFALMPYAWPRCTTVKIHWYRHAMRQIENFDFDPQNKIRIFCLARSLQAHSRALNQSVIVERVTCRSSILRYWTGTYWTVANCGFLHGFSTIFRCFVNFKHTTNDMAE